jgi:FkbM family methyltransferase
VAAGLVHPLWIRPGTSDATVFIEVVVEGDYAPLYGLDGVVSIIDLGANIGCSAASFLSRYPSAHVIAVEPDEQNFSLLARNLKPYGDRAKCVNAGVWNKSVQLALVAANYRDGQNWSRQVRECRPGSPGAIRGVDVPSLIEMSGHDRVSILKVDIEGAEVVLFDESCSTWLNQIDNIVIELHDDSSFGMASPVFWAAVAGQGFCFSKSRELFVGRRSISPTAR